MLITDLCESLSDFKKRRCKNGKEATWVWHKDIYSANKKIILKYMYLGCVCLSSDILLWNSIHIKKKPQMTEDNDFNELLQI